MCRIVLSRSPDPYSSNQTQNYSYNQDNQPIQIDNFTLTRNNKDRNITITDGTYTKISNINKYGELKKTEDNTLSVKLKRNLLGQIVKKVETLKNQRKNIYHYSYDDRGRLTQVKERKNIVESYTYDSNGNRQSATVHNQTITASYTLDDNLIVYGQNTYSYDDDGYLTEKTTPNGTTTYAYGTLGELLIVTTPTTSTGSVTVISYQHNANNQRVAKLVNGQVVEKYLWENLTTLLAVYDANDNLVQRFEYAESRMPISMTQNNQKYYLHYDQVGSLRAVTDDSQNIVKEITYDTYGNILTDSNEAFKVPFGFAGGLYDSDTKLTRFGYRDYDAYTGKWTAKDPIGFQGGDSNLYGYVLGDPVSGFDANGLAKNGGPYHPPVGVKVKCTSKDSCQQILKKIYLLDKMIKSHEGWDRNVPKPRGGNRHADEIAKLWRAYAKCQALQQKKCSSKKECRNKDIVPSPPWWLLPARVVGGFGAAILAP